ncbi:DUF1810 domain-containing protein [Mucilaginibacter ginsenosidivorax]|uniref:DUF1810 domain-containing protein n=1 Tax=Mucilaginibacter ginsenosidivorax TaxID=862126 RepID=A0A5B8VUB6_9SPHI|nr:DUF1810 domain-containing protein [Mucilaginibacter ginsenosidivorax]QEC74721.1 DUF1810 domain-containing protein [Mucilaginibacter ginsenosidivorax]
MVKATALTEIKSGRKRSHWMWYVFPQIAGLGCSDMAKGYAIADLAEATDYLAHPVPGKRIKEITAALLGLDSHNAPQVMDNPDDLKLRPSMTLFALVEGAGSVLEAVLKKYFDGHKDQATIQLIR